ncbi:UDP-N-acetylmuramoyl-L-alanyl-D-glutamate--2,6-diaminopimelate ligase [Thermovibrio sp.]
MVLGELLLSVGIKLNGKLYSLPVRGITEDSRKLGPGYLFFAYKGTSSDGNLFIGEAVKKGALAVITDSEKSLKRWGRLLPVFLVKEPRKSLSLLSAKFYGNPERELSLIGITGTNGKTTTALLTQSALSNLGEGAGYIGTLGYKVGSSELTPLERTTPSPSELFSILRDFVSKGCKFAVVEVSSHALELDRVFGITFSSSAFTNLTPEHLDFHRDIYSYFLSKEKLFFNSKVSVFNLDDPWGRVLVGLKGLFKETLSYGSSPYSDFQILSFKGGSLTLSYLNDTYAIPTSLKGYFNAYNLTCSFALLVSLGFSPEELSSSYKGVKVPGRFEEVYRGVFVDYAHTPDALEKLLKTASSICRGKLITVFGCGGDRDKSKRAPMGRIAYNYSDLVIITNDNPRNEEPEIIISDILSGIPNLDRVLVIPDRKEAIFKALSLKGEEDLVVIAGKGHEDYQIVKGKKEHFSDREVVSEFYKCKKACRDS